MVKKPINYIISVSLGMALLISCTSRSAKNAKRADQANDRKTTVINDPIGIRKNKYYQVIKVVDGDTFWIDNLQIGGLKIRFIGIDAPESRNAFRKKKQFYGKESKVYLTNLLKDQKVRLEFDVDSLDPFGRTLAYVYLESGEMVNELIVKSGNGILMTISPNVKYEELFINAQKYAREHKLGLWGSDLIDENEY